MSELRVLFVTATEAEAPQLVRTLVAEGLVACGNIMPGVRSIYRYKDEVCDETEAVIWMETTESRLAEVRARIAKLHSYDVPKIVALQAADVADAYLQWVRESTAPAPAPG